MKYIAEVVGHGENVWSRNTTFFDTEDEAKSYLRGLASRWFGFDASRIVPEDTPPREKVDATDSRIFQNYF